MSRALRGRAPMGSAGSGDAALRRRQVCLRPETTYWNLVQEEWELRRA